MTADRTTTTPAPSDAADLLREMAAVIRTVFGAGLQAASRATDTVAAEPEAPRVQAVATPPATPTQLTPAAAPASIPVPATLPVPGLPAAAQAPHPVEPAEPAEPEEPPTAYAGEVPQLRVIPNPAPVEDVSSEHRQAVLREVAFLDE